MLNLKVVLLLVVLLTVPSLSFELGATDFYDSNELVRTTKGTVYYHPNTTFIPQNSTVEKIEMAIGGNIDGLVVYLTSPEGNVTLKGMSFDTRLISQTYVPKSGNVITKINFATYLESDGRKTFCGIQFVGTTEESTFYMGSYSKKVTTHESIQLHDNFVGFYGHLHFGYRTINGIGLILQKND